AAGLQAFDNAFHHFAWVGKFVVSVHEQHYIHRRTGQLGIGLVAEDGLDVVGIALFFAAFDDGQHFGLNVHGQDFALFDHWGDAEAEIAGARANVSDYIRWFQVHLLDDFVRQFGLFAVGTFQPSSALVAHHVGDLAAHVKFADAVGVVVGAGFVNRFAR